MDKATSLIETIFSAGHNPVRKIGRSMYGTGHAVSHPSTKSPTGIVRARSPLMADGLLHLDTDPNVVRISPYPMEALIWSTTDGVTPVKTEHVPDVAILTQDGSVTFVDYVEVSEQRKTAGFRRLVAERIRHFQGELGCAYAVMDELEVRREPRLSNVRLMWTHRSRPTEPQSLSRARQAIRTARLPATIRSVFEASGVGRQAIRFAGDGVPTALRETNLLFSAAMQLAMRGEVRLDLGRPLTLDSTIYGVTA